MEGYFSATGMATTFLTDKGTLVRTFLWGLNLRLFYCRNGGKEKAD